MRLEETTLTLTKFSLLFSNYSLTAEVIKLWHELFVDEELSHFYAAMAATVKESNRVFFPTPGEVQKNLDVIKRGQNKVAAEIWEMLVTLAKHRDAKGAAELLITDDAAERALYQIGGFATIRLADLNHELPHRKREFIRYYDEQVLRLSDQARIETSHKVAKRVIGPIPGVDKILSKGADVKLLEAKK